LAGSQGQGQRPQSRQVHFLRGAAGSPVPPAAPVAWVPSPNVWPGCLHEPLAIVIHTECGSERGTIAQFSAWGGLSSTFSVGLDGAGYQHVSIDPAVCDAAEANGILEPGNSWPGPQHENPNWRTFSIETEDNGDPDHEPVTDAQYATTLYICRLILAIWPGVKYLMGHYVISPRSRSCPAARWRAGGRLAELAEDAGLELRL
jgi:hypothetical protein